MLLTYDDAHRRPEAVIDISLEAERNVSVHMVLPRL